MKAFVEPDGVDRSRMQRWRPDHACVFPMRVEQARIPDDIAGIGMAFEIVEGFYGKENAIHPKNEGVKQ